jgi:hypothetical protein
MLKLKGNEKFWNALLGGGMVAAVNTLVLWMLSSFTTIPMPDVAMVMAAIFAVIQTLFTAAIVYVTGNTPTQDNTTIPPEATLVLPEKVEQPKSVEIKTDNVPVVSSNNEKTIVENPPS